MPKNHKKSRILTVRSGTPPTPERRHHNGGVLAEIVYRDAAGKILIKRYRAAWECPLDKYRDLGAISPEEYHAGLKFRKAYFRAVLGVKIVNKGSESAKDIEMSFLMPIYSERLLRSAYEILSPKQKTVVIGVCGHNETAGTTAKLRTLHRGLERLCDTWKMRATSPDSEA